MSKEITNIKLKDWNGKEFDFFDFQGNDHLLLIFYRGYWCNICRAQLDEINKNKKLFDKAKIKILAISGDEPLYASLLSSHLKAKFPILPDPKMKSFKKFNLPTPKNKEDILPAVFLISPNHKIIYKDISKDPEKRPEVKEILSDFLST